jgi:replication initiation and membrane attachment protein DnaB
MSKTRFNVIKKYAFSIDNALLLDLYSPIIGKTATILYTSFLNEVKKQSLTNGFATDLCDFLKYLGVSENEFNESRKFLEALNLLNTYYETDDVTKNTNYKFVLREPLCFHDFVSNQKYRHLLIKAIGQTNYEKLEFFYGCERISNKSTNITATFESIFNDEEIKSITNVNFKDLYKHLSAYTSTPIIIDDKSKSVIESYFKAYDLSLNEIKRIITNAVIYTDDKIYRVDGDLLKTSFDNFIDGVNNINVLKNIKLNRNAHMFIKHLTNTELKAVYNDYLSINSEQYLRAIFKCPLVDEQIQLIKTLKNNYCLPDGIINLIVDFTLFKLNGKLNEKYVCKVAKTINALNYQTIQQVYDHFHFLNSINNLKTQTITHNNEVE